jgi:hypothetical protein
VAREVPQTDVIVDQQHEFFMVGYRLYHYPSVADRFDDCVELRRVKIT